MEHIDWKKEFILTFSNQKSLLSSKKIERFIVFWTFLILTIIYIAFNIKTIEAIQFVELAALWLGYGSVNGFMALREKKVNSQYPDPNPYYNPFPQNNPNIPPVDPLQP